MNQSRDLVIRGAFGRVELSENVQLVETGERDEHQVPDHQDDSETSVQFPAVVMDRDY